MARTGLQAALQQSAKGTPPAEKPAASPDEKMDLLIEKAHQAMRDRHFIDPADGSALTLYRDALRLDPGNGWYHYFIGGALSDSGDKTAALAELEKARKLDLENDTFRSEYESLLREVKK